MSISFAIETDLFIGVFSISIMNAKHKTLVKSKRYEPTIAYIILIGLGRIFTNEVKMILFHIISSRYKYTKYKISLDKTYLTMSLVILCLLVINDNTYTLITWS